MADSKSLVRLKAILKRKKEELHKKVADACDLLSAIQNGHEVEVLPRAALTREPMLHKEKYR